jgi:NAD(P)-dependent dehydrogenase (short-subunit alcohol dehydrogenase family)
MSGVYPDLSGRVAIVTGAGAGIGRATAAHLAAQGLAIVVAELDAKTGRDAAQEIEQAGGRALAVEVDVGDDAAVGELVGRAVDHFGRIDSLVNNAGM